MTFNQWYNANSHLVDDPNGDAFTLAKEAWDYQQRIIQEQALQMISDFGQYQEAHERVDELQAKLDSLMLEYCPENMTKEQIRR